ncbi:MAG TPA: MiaB/RimO family radical SAM methylthiotransferase, partial [Gemmatimonadaceae bacterium]
YVETHGCRANQYDSEAVLELARRGGYEISNELAGADVAVINTCAVTAEAERDARKSARRVTRLNPSGRTIVMGCSAALPASRETLSAVPGVTHVVGGADLDAVAAALGVSVVAGTVRQRTVRAQLRVQDGCDEHCTFCATTLARGANRSRHADAVVREAQSLAEHHPEIVITGTHIGTYGRDIGSSLGALLQRLVRDVPGVRFRLSSIEATEVDEALIELMSSDPHRLAPHVHAPLQSGSDGVLKRMGRHWYSAASYADAVAGMASRLPVFGLGADVIVGFPGETASDFDATLRMVRDLPFTYLHVFTYSPRPGTSAPRLAETVAPSIAAERSTHLRELGTARAELHAARRATGAADAIVIHAGERVDAMTEDFMSLPVLGARRSRGDRFQARVDETGAALSPL